MQILDSSGFSFPESFQRLDIRIVDLGEASFANQPRSSLGGPFPYFPVQLCSEYSASAMSEI